VELPQIGLIERALTVTDLAAEVRESNQRFSTTIDNLNIEVARINLHLGFIRRSIFILVPILGTLLLGGIDAAYKIVWDTGQLHGAVGTLQRDVGTLNQDVDKLKQDVGTLKQHMATFDERMTRLEHKMTSQEATLSRIEKAVIK
jgi:outer membrane murein-binding lipoprotein Lpp